MFRVAFFAFFCLPLIGLSQHQETLKASYNQAIKQKDLVEAMNLSTQLGAWFMGRDQYSEALEWYSTGLKHAILTRNHSGQYVCYEGIGVSLYNQKNYSKAADNFEKSIEAAHKALAPEKEMNGHMNLAKAESKRGRHKRALSPLDAALSIALQLKDETAQLSCYTLLIESYQQLENEKQVEVFQNLKSQLINSRKLADNHNKKLIELENQMVRIETDKLLTESDLQKQKKRLIEAEDSLRQAEAVSRQKQMEIDLLNLDKELAAFKIREQNAVIANDRLWRKSLIIGIVLVSVLVVVIVFSYRKSVVSNRRIQEQSKNINKQNENIKSSITYARRIQEAMLPSQQRMKEFFSESFVLFKPRDLVSGDFYWCGEMRNGHKENDFAFAAVDCTGHGVPGAFMSMVGMNSLNGMINRGIKHSHEMLGNLHREIRSSLRQPETGNNDGMDIALCIYRKDRKVIEFSGAKNPMVYIQNNELFQVKGDIHPIGGSKSKAEIEFKKHEISVAEPTMLYLFSDGYRDQFGGKENTKFMSKKFNQLLLKIHQLPMAEQQQILESTLKEWKGNKPQTDDVLVIGVRC